MHLAAQGGHTGVVELLLRKGAQTEARDKDNNTLLHLATKGGYTGTVELLVRKHAQTESIDKGNSTHCTLL